MNIALNCESVKQFKSILEKQIKIGTASSIFVADQNDSLFLEFCGSFYKEISPNFPDLNICVRTNHYLCQDPPQNRTPPTEGSLIR